MGPDNSLVMIACIAAGVALVAVVACVVITVVLARREDAPSPAAHAVAPVVRMAPAPNVRVGWILPSPQQHPVAQRASSFHEAPLTIQRPWPGVVDALGHHMRSERDPVDRVGAAQDLGAMGGARPARMLVDAVRDGVISPAAGAQAIIRTGFDGGVMTGIALAETDPRVRTMVQLVLAGSEVPTA